MHFFPATTKAFHSVVKQDHKYEVRKDIDFSEREKMKLVTVEDETEAKKNLMPNNDLTKRKGLAKENENKKYDGQRRDEKNNFVTRRELNERVDD